MASIGQFGDEIVRGFWIPVSRVDGEDGLASGGVRQREEELAIEATGTSKCRIDRIQTVRRADHDHLTTVKWCKQVLYLLLPRYVCIYAHDLGLSIRSDGYAYISTRSAAFPGCTGQFGCFLLADERGIRHSATMLLSIDRL